MRVGSKVRSKDRDLEYRAQRVELRDKGGSGRLRVGLEDGVVGGLKLY